MPKFTHLHVHSHYSMLDGMSKVPDLISKCKKQGMYSIALTDHGNMFGIKDLVDSVGKENGKVKGSIKEKEALLESATEDEKQSIQEEIDQLKGTIFKPIIGIEAYCARRTLHDMDPNVMEFDPESGKDRSVDRSGYHLILLAKNKTGYQSLCKLSSIAYTQGYYYSPRIDHALLEQYHEGLIVCSACLGGEIPQKIMRGDIEGAEQSILWFKNLFGEDFYIELQRHKTNKPNANYQTYVQQEKVNPILIELARKHNIKIIATNDVHFVEESHGEAHDRLICVATNKKYDEPRMHYTKQEWLKSPEEMAEIFSDVPEAISNTQEIVDKVEVYSIDSDPIMPVFPIPESFGKEEEWRNKYSEEDLFNEFTRNEKGEVVLSQEAAEKKIKKLGGYNKLYRIKYEADYLEQLVWAGAHKRYGEDLTEEQTERIVFELHTIKTMGFPGYFLIVQDYIRGAREELGVSVGPGRGSAAGSVVAYCLWITDVDPLKYDLLFERFLNPDRISLPDIDVDFDDAGRGKVLDWITQKYGSDRVAHIITYGTMATKSVIADVARVHEVPLSTVDQLKKLIPEKSFPDNIKDEKGKSPKVNLRNCYKYVPELNDIVSDPTNELSPLLGIASELEDTNRQIGIHACGVIIGADDLTNFAPLCTIKDKDTGENVLVTQYDGHVVENVGLIKMDFLGLKNLTIIKDAIRMIKKRTGDVVDIDNIPIDDPLTYQLYCDGNTVGTFQFESVGMQKYLRQLQPHVFEDLIAMNALYRPGPMDYIPDFIDRKLGKKPVTYDIPCMEKYLKDTYGITVYQEQVMLLSRQLANFTRGQSDTLRKAMGKKQIEKMNELEVLFYEGGVKNGHDKKVLNKIWEDWKKFASYAFNKSHATCYSWVSYQTAYLKAHYPAEYMAAVMTSAQNDIARVTELMEDCKKNHIEILPPSINESEQDFSVNAHGAIRFGLQAMKGVGEAAVSSIIEEREANGPFSDVFDLLKRVNLKAVNRKALEVLVKGGAFDEFTDIHRAQYFHREDNNENNPTFIEILHRWAINEKDASQRNQISIFDGFDELHEALHPEVPKAERWTAVELCNYEKEALNLYLTSHPLDEYKLEHKYFINTKLSELDDLERISGRQFSVGGIVTASSENLTKSGTPMGKITLEDYSGSYEFKFWGQDATAFRNYFIGNNQGVFLCIKGVVETIRFSKKDANGNLIREEGQPRIKIKEIMPMEEMAQSCTKSLLCYLNLKDLTSEFSQELFELMKENKGKVPIIMRVVDTENNISLTMTTGKNLIDPRKIYKKLEQLPQINKIVLERKF